MAKATIKNVGLQLKYAGAVVDGKQTYVYKTYSKVKSTVADQALLDVATVLAGLQNYTINEITKSVDTGLEA